MTGTMDTGDKREKGAADEFMTKTDSPGSIGYNW